MSAADELRKLADLLKEGLITQDDYDRQKDRLLNQPTPPAHLHTETFRSHPGAKPQSYMAEAILVTLLCCLPFGIVGIVNAAGVDSAWAAGDYALAYEKSKKAHQWNLWGFGAGLLVGLAYLLMAVGAAG